MTGHGEKDQAHAEHDFEGPLQPRTRKLTRGFLVASALLFVADFFVKRETHARAGEIPGFYAVYGFVGCVVFVLVAKEMRKVVGRDEWFHDGDDR